MQLIDVCFQGAMVETQAGRQVKFFADFTGFSHSTLVHNKNLKQLFISYLKMGLCPKPHFIFWLEPKNEAKKLQKALRSAESKQA